MTQFFFVGYGGCNRNVRAMYMYIVCVSLGTVMTNYCSFIWDFSCTFVSFLSVVVSFCPCSLLESDHIAVLFTGISKCLVGATMHDVPLLQFHCWPC